MQRVLLPRFALDLHSESHLGSVNRTFGKQMTVVCFKVSARLLTTVFLHCLAVFQVFRTSQHKQGLEMQWYEYPRSVVQITVLVSS